jgi:hypothetical protein
VQKYKKTIAKQLVYDIFEVISIIKCTYANNSQRYIRKSWLEVPDNKIQTFLVFFLTKENVTVGTRIASAIDLGVAKAAPNYFAGVLN